MPFPYEDDGARPCPKMRTLLSRLADGSLTGIAHWFTRFHAGHCPRCTSALSALMVLRERLRTLRALRAPEQTAPPTTPRLSPERRAQVEEALDRVDKELV